MFPCLLLNHLARLYLQKQSLYDYYHLILTALSLVLYPSHSSINICSKNKIKCSTKFFEASKYEKNIAKKYSFIEYVFTLNFFNENKAHEYLTIERNDQMYQFLLSQQKSDGLPFLIEESYSPWFIKSFPNQNSPHCTIKIGNFYTI